MIEYNSSQLHTIFNATQPVVESSDSVILRLVSFSIVYTIMMIVVIYYLKIYLDKLRKQINDEKDLSK
jgi:cytochrome bd-type quinol oxidase subunit 1